MLVAPPIGSYNILTLALHIPAFLAAQPPSDVPDLRIRENRQPGNCTVQRSRAFPTAYMNETAHV